MTLLRRARALVYFRALRSVGYFAPSDENSRKYTFSPCRCENSPRLEDLPNGLPEGMKHLSFLDIFEELGAEIEAHCLTFPYLDSNEKTHELEM